jgi:hypothetical protein
MDSDALVLRWLAHYVPSILLLALAGAVAAAAYLDVKPVQHEGWSIVIETNNEIPALQLGNVAEAVFLTQKVYGPAMRALHMKESPFAFLKNTVELRPVPGTNSLIVVGRAADVRTAERISSAMADSLINAFADRTPKARFVRFGSAQPAPVSTRLSPAFGVSLGAAIGLWLGLALAVIHYRWRKPALTLSSAVSALDPYLVTSIARRRRFIVFPAGRLERRERAWVRAKLQTLLPGPSTISEVRVVIPGLSRRRRERLVGLLSSALTLSPTDGKQAAGAWRTQPRTEPPITVVVSTASTRLEALEELRIVGPSPGSDGDSPPIALVWVR